MIETSNIYESIDEMVRLCHEKIQLMGELKRALMLAELIGRKPGDLKWTLTVRWQEGTSSFFPWTGTVMHVCENHPDGPINHAFDMLDQVPRDLWPEHLRHGYEMQEARAARRRQFQAERRAKN